MNTKDWQKKFYYYQQHEYDFDFTCRNSRHNQDRDNSSRGTWRDFEENFKLNNVNGMMINVSDRHSHACHVSSSFASSLQFDYDRVAEVLSPEKLNHYGLILISLAHHRMN